VRPDVEHPLFTWIELGIFFSVVDLLDIKRDLSGKK
jgi:hypothetical protein